MNHFRTQRTQSLQSNSLPCISNMNDAGDDGNATPFSTSKPRRSHMKKATHIVALPVLTALLAACAAPVEQGRLDQIEEVTTALADQTLMEGLRDDFEEVRKQLDEAKEQATEGQQQLMAELEDDFEEVEKQLGEVEEQTDLSAKLDLADKLKQELEVLALELDKAKSAEDGVLDEEILYRELTYTFRNLDAVALTKDNRMNYIDKLQKFFRTGKYIDRYGKEWQVSGYRLDSTEYQHKRDPDREEWSPNKTRKGWELAGVQFKLSNLEKGIDKPRQERIRGIVKKVTDENAAGLVEGTPVVGKAAPPKPVVFKTLAVNYTSASGTGIVGDIPIERVICPSFDARYTVTGIAKQRDAKPYVYEQGVAKLITSEGSFPVQSSWDGEGCKVSGGKPEYIMVLLRDKETGLYVAEYHTITANVPEGTYATGAVGQESMRKLRLVPLPWPGELTEKLPACPPTSWPQPWPHKVPEIIWPEPVRAAFMNVLGSALGKKPSEACL